MKDKHPANKILFIFFLTVFVLLMAVPVFIGNHDQIPGLLYHRPRIIRLFKIAACFSFFAYYGIIGIALGKPAIRGVILFEFVVSCVMMAFLVFVGIHNQYSGYLHNRTALVTVIKAAIFLVILAGPFAGKTAAGKIILCLHSISAAAVIVVVSTLILFPKYAVYADADHTKDSVFGNKKVMAIVPHQDDDVNILGGVMQQFVSYGSDVYEVFTTNGDFYGWGETRLHEAIQGLSRAGIPENHIIFLGYGDQWQDSHIYNMPEDEPMRSAVGNTATYGLPNHPAFHDGNLYTFGNYLSDIEDVITEYKPEVLFCVDYDPHIDHRATSLTAEKALGRILQKNPDYRPMVLKGFGYSTAWYSPDDFYSKNIKSTQAPGGEYMTEVNFYRWDQRLRLPMAADGLSRSLFTSSVYEQFYEHKSQDAVCMAGAICNGDKVFWQRSTESLAYQAHVTASSGEAGVIHDFMLHDTRDLHKPKDDFGIWVPDETDSLKQITLQLPEKSNIAWIYLYDNPSFEDNIEAATIILDNGSRISTGKLDASGCPTKIQIDAADVQSITLEINRSEGTYAGLSEIELYEHEPAPAFDFIKLMDSQEDFVYDYYMPGDSMELLLYRCGAAPELSPENYTVSTDNPKCRAEIEDGHILVYCPKGQQCVLTISDADGVYRDSVLLRNRRSMIFFGQTVEEIFTDFLLKDGLIYKINAVFPHLFSR